MNILALETATESCSATLCVGDECFHTAKVAPRQHTELILPMIDELLSQASIKKHELDCLAFGQGPGAFTGVRIASGIVQGLAYSLNKPVVAISSLRALAQAYADKYEYIAVAFDARMGEVYWGCFQSINGIATACAEEQVTAPENLTLSDTHKFVGVGTGFGAYKELLQQQFEDRLLGVFTEVYPSAKEIAQLALVEYEHGNFYSAAEVKPVYLRDKVV